MGTWRVVATVPGGELPFTVQLSESGGRLNAHVVNGEERVPIGEVTLVNDVLTLNFPAFNNTLVLKAGNSQMSGTLTLVKRYGELQVMPVVANYNSDYRFAPPNNDNGIDINGR